MLHNLYYPIARKRRGYPRKSYNVEGIQYTCDFEHQQNVQFVSRFPLVSAGFWVPGNLEPGNLETYKIINLELLYASFK
jgi:hypothetical protein